MPFEVVVAPGLLFCEQKHVCGHEIDTSLQSQGGADERRLEQEKSLAVVFRDGFTLLRVLLHKLFCYVKNVFCLSLTLHLVFFGREVGTGGIGESVGGEMPFQRGFPYLVVRFVAVGAHEGVEQCVRIVSEKNGLAVC